MKDAFRLTYRSGHTHREVLDKMDECTDWGKVADKFRTFIRPVLTAKKPYNLTLRPMKSY